MGPLPAILDPRTEDLASLMRNFEPVRVRYGKVELRAWREYANQIQVGFENAEQVVFHHGWKRPEGAPLHLNNIPESKAPAVILDFTFTLHGYGFPISGFNFITVCLMERSSDRHTATTSTLLATLDVEKTDLWRAKSTKDLVNKLLRLEQHSRTGPVVKALLDNVQNAARA
jgi:hypothetical protein